MRVPGLFLGFLLLAWSLPVAAAERIFEFGLVVCQQQPAAAPAVVLASVASSELVLPVAELDMPAQESSLPPHEGRPCADVLTDLTRSGYALAASTPFSRRSPPPEDIFLRNKPAVTERLEWTVQLSDSVAILSCEPLADAVASFADGATPPAFSPRPGASCAAYMAGLLALGGEIVGRHATAPPGSTPPTGPVTVLTAYELMRAFPTPQQNLPRVPRTNQGRSRRP